MRTLITSILLIVMMSSLCLGEVVMVWHDDLQDATAGGPRNYWGCSLAEDGDGYITINVPSNGTFSTTMPADFQVQQGDLLIYQVSSTTPSFNVQPQVQIDGVHYTFEGSITSWGTQIYTKEYEIPATGVLTQINMKSNWSSNEVITYYDYKIYRHEYPDGYVWRDTLDEATTNRFYNEVLLIEDGDGYIEIEPLIHNGCRVNTLSDAVAEPVLGLPIQVEPGDQFVAKFQVTRLPADDGQVQDVYCMLNLNGSYSVARMGGGNISDTDVHYITYEFADTATLSEVQFLPAWGLSTSGDSARVRVYDYSIIRSVPVSCEELAAAGQSAPADFTGDCYVNIADFSQLAADWLSNNDPDSY